MLFYISIFQYLCQKNMRIMVYELKESDNLADLLEEIKRKNREKEGKKEKKTLEKHYGCLKRGLDGLEYQKACRNEWN